MEKVGVNKNFAMAMKASLANILSWKASHYLKGHFYAFAIASDCVSVF